MIGYSHAGVQNILANEFDSTFEMMGKDITMIEESESDEVIEDGNEKHYTFI